MQDNKNSREHYEDRINILEKEIYRMYKAKMKADVEIYLKTTGEPNSSYKAHKLILAAKSPVFADLFWNTSNSMLEIVVVDGVTAKELNLLLEYIYNDNLETKTVDELIEISKAARRFGVTGVVGKCKHQINNYPLSAENVFGVLEASKYFKLQRVEAKCLEFIKDLPQYFTYIDSPGIFQLSASSMYDVLRTRHVTLGCEALVLEGVVRWLVHHKINGRQFLSEINVLSLTSEEFLDITEKYLDFFTYREIASITSNIIRPGSKELPAWCKSRHRFSSNCNSLTYHSIASKSIQFEAECNRLLPKCVFYSGEYFHQSMFLEIKIPPQTSEHMHLTMLELAFGSDFIPKSNLNVELSHLKENCKMADVEFILQETSDHYYIVFQNNLKMMRHIPFSFKLNIKMSGLRQWGVSGPVSNGKYRIAVVPENIFCNIRLKAKYPFSFDPICLTPLNDWIVLIDPVENEKKFVLHSFYFGV